MGAKLHLEGQKFGKLIVLQETNKRKNKSVVWKCQCNCGNIEYFSTKQLRSDGLIQCHQCGHKRQPKKVKENIIGKKFNFLTVIEETNERNESGIIYKCLCDCGKQVFTTRKYLNNNDVKSCGCKRFKYKVGDVINNKKIINLYGKDLHENNKEEYHYYRCKCLLCGREYDVTADSMNKSIGCGCVKSIGEKNIYNILTKNNIFFIKQYTFPNTKFRFDFAILNKNQQIIRLIEFDGEQHYYDNVKSSGWNSIQHYKKTYKHDLIKNNLAFQNEIPLVRIPYWERYNISLDMIMGDKYLKEKD